MKPKIFTDHIEANNRLLELGLNNSQVIAVVEAMTTARVNCTENHPSSAPGLLSWIEGTARLREETICNGWERKDIDQVPNVVNHDTKVRLAVMNTDDNTGLIERTPQPTSKKGSATKRATNSNQREFADDFPDFGEATINTCQHQADGLIQWYIMVYADSNLVRAEVSCPISLVDGRFNAFSERIIISVDYDKGGREPVRKTTPPTSNKSEFEVSVKRKIA